MKSRLIAQVAATLLAGTVFAAAQQSGAPSGEKDRTGAATDSSQTSANPQRPAGAGGQGTVGTGAGMGSSSKSAPGPDRTPLQPGGVSPSQPPQGQDTGQEANPRPR